MRGKEFFEEMKTLAEPHAKEAYENTAALLSDLSEDATFRMLAQFWWLEGGTLGGFGRTWWQTIPMQPQGQYRDVELFLARQLYDESRHGKLFADACIRKGFIQCEQDLYVHPYGRPIPGMLNFATWLQHLGQYNFTTLYAGEQMASECLTFPEFIKAALKYLKDPIVHHVFAAQEHEEAFHGYTGRYVVSKYCQTAAQQDEAHWAAQNTWRILGAAMEDLRRFMKDGEFVPIPPDGEYPRVGPPEKPRTSPR